MKKDFFLHLESTLKFQVQLLDEGGDPLDMDNTTVLFGVAEDSTTNTLAILDIGDGVTVVDPNQAIIEVAFTPKKEDGFSDRNLVYQIQATITHLPYTYVALEGRIFITPSLFD